MIKAIETQYRGYRFRSRLEARWAVFFDALGLQWQYEPEGFELPSGWYLPDFYLQTPGIYIEVKPAGIGWDDQAKAERFLHELACMSERPTTLFKDIPDPAEIAGWHPLWYAHREEEEGYWCGVMPHSIFRGDLRFAAQAARGARFEHGERVA